MRKRVFKFKKGDLVPKYMMESFPPVDIIFNTDVRVRFLVHKGYNITIEPTTKDFENVVLIKNGEYEDLDVKCNHILIRNPFGEENHVNKLQ